MKLEVKHLAPYLPYGLKGMRIDYESLGEHELVGLTVWDIITSGGKLDYKYFKPLLHPLSRLTDKMVKDFGYAMKEDFIVQIQNETVLVNVWNDLISNHWDVFGLIEKGLAEPIETSKAKGE